VRSRKDTHFTAVSPTLSLILGTLSVVSGIAAAPTGTENIEVYLAIAVFARVDIIYKWITKIIKDVRAIDR